MQQRNVPPAVTKKKSITKILTHTVVHLNTWWELQLLFVSLLPPGCVFPPIHITLLGQGSSDIYAVPVCEKGKKKKKGIISSVFTNVLLGQNPTIWVRSTSFKSELLRTHPHRPREKHHLSVGPERSSALEDPVDLEGQADLCLLVRLCPPLVLKSTKCDEKNSSVK